VSERILDALVFLGVVALILVVGIAVGMLIAPRIGRLSEPHDEEPGGDD
jgi:hypothetical protein